MNKGLLNTVGLLTPPPAQRTSKASAAGDDAPKVAAQVDVAGAVAKLAQAKKICIVPGYGLAVSKGQYPLAEVVKMLTSAGKKVVLAIHPVLRLLLLPSMMPLDRSLEGCRGSSTCCWSVRLPWKERKPNLNVGCQAEAGIPYDIVKEMEEINEDWDDGAMGPASLYC
eukprot:754255-Hanusia_phi.AAC.3